MTSVTVLGERAEPFAGYAARCGWSVTRGAPYGDVVVAADPAYAAELLAHADAGGAVVLLDPAAWRDSPLLDRAGVVPGAVVGAHEQRVRPGRDAGDVAARLAGDVYVTAPLLLVEKTTDDTAVLLAATWQLAEQPVATLRGRVATYALPLGDAVTLRLLHRVCRAALGVADGGPVRVGLLGYGAIGDEHARAVSAVEGLTLAAVCDRSAARVAAARLVAPDVAAVGDAEALLARDDVDLVVVSTPPDTHVSWTLAALRAGKHVVVEKPFCLAVAEADAMIALAAERDRVLAVYQNRRWDPDFLALRSVLRSGAVGDVFHLESFVGGYGHPCNYWHSDADVSGGAIYDWGSHHLDWTLDLLPGPVEWVSATTHKRVWHDVTNADHSRVLLHFAGGVEAEFTHSDLAAARKPKWYVLGTRGAVVGTYADAPVPTDLPATIEVHAPGGAVTRVAVPDPPPHAFHRELADALLSGEPMSVTPEGSRRNIAVMEAAAASARDGGRPVEVTA